MSGMFDDRKKSYENKFAHDLELDFKLNARANKLMALWAAEQMGKDDTDAMSYAMEVVESGLRLTGEWNVIDKISQDLSRAGITMTREDLQDTHARIRAEAREQLLAE